MTELIATDLGGIDLCYETFGEPEHRPLLLIMGLAAPMTWWDDEFCALLADRGFHVIRYDNRDVGRSSRMHGRADPLSAVLLHRAPYSLADLADDAAALLTRLGIESAHVVGTSMGGMIGQLLTIRHPRRVRSLTSIMSTTGRRLVGLPSPKAMLALLSPAPRDREGYVEHHLATFRTLASPGFPVDEQRLRTRAEVTYNRGIDPAGVARQFAAVLSAPDRTADLRRLRLPVTVVHGASDPLVSVSGGIATARAIPGAELHVLHGMGHDIPRQLWSRLADFIEHTATVRAPADR